MKTLLFFSISLALLSCVSQKNTLARREAAFLTWFSSKIDESVVAQKSIAPDIRMIANFPQMGFFPQDSILLSRRDSQQTIYQVSLGGRLFPADYFPNKILLLDAEERSLKKSEFRPYHRFSRPIFFGNRVWIYHEEVCTDCGSGTLEVYEIEGGFRLLYAKQLWIS